VTNLPRKRLVSPFKDVMLDAHDRIILRSTICQSLRRESLREGSLRSGA